MIGFKFGLFNLQDPANGVWVTKTNVYSAPTNDIQADALANRDGAYVVKQTYRSKTFQVEGVLRSSTRAGLEQLMDTFKTVMAQKNQAFDVDYAGGIRRFLANATTVIIADIGLTSAAFSVEMMSPDGMGWSLDQVNLIDSSSITTSTAVFSALLIGSYQIEPVIRLELTSVTGGTNKTVTITNGASLRGIRITRNWSSGDVLEFDSAKRTLYVNSIETDFQGQFPVFDPGTAILNYLDDFSARTATIRSYYTPRWL